jgi:hypothetical protein
MGYFTILEENPEGRNVRVRVDLADESVFFKYDHVPTQDEVDWEVIALLTNREVEATRQREQDGAADQN